MGIDDGIPIVHKNITFSVPEHTNTIVFYNNQTKPYLTITRDGRMLIGEGLSTEEATRAVAEMLVKEYARALDRALTGMQQELQALRVQYASDIAEAARQIEQLKGNK